MIEILFGFCHYLGTSKLISLHFEFILRIIDDINQNIGKSRQICMLLSKFMYLPHYGPLVTFVASLKNIFIVELEQYKKSG